MKEIGIYLKERFPLPLVLLLATGYALFLVGIGAPQYNSGLVAMFTALAFTAFLLRQRVTDEFKDLKHDTKNYPHRPLQRGLISKQQLIGIGIASLIVELAAVYAVGGPTSLAWYGPVFAFTLLMGVEFFCSRWLEKHFTLYFIAHQCVFIGFIAWYLGATGTPISPTVLAAAAAFLFTMCSVEIVRKFEIRRDAKNKIVLDTYPAVWGRSLSVLILAACIVGTGALLSFSTGHVYPMIISAVAIFAITWQRSNDNGVRIISATAFIAQAVGVFIV
jgi:4-hydroxybenzoate polyprenyltransferase